MNAVFFETNDDATTMQVHQSRRKALSANSAYPQYKLFGIDAHYSDLRNTHSKAGRFDLFSGMAHGANDHFTGQLQSVTFATDDRVKTTSTVKNTIVHLFSCDCGKDLGPYLVRNGAKAFIGYVNPISIGSSQNVTDEIVKVAAAIDFSIIAGDSQELTKVKANAEFMAMETRLSASASATPRDVAIARLNHRSMVGPWTDRKYGAF